ncbi:YdiU family protein [Microvirga tunisiensis]|uniref:YdiU family protein n=2 Tax=Pannonibacter tanglangensis TaxID=2750084 RepID=A0ABW9ZPD1_9HYPH|nr:MULTISPECIES: YdiU family protein [unclassified Pannonibacter]NBN65436.1 YdiU family protein [Pannonibacter sp. XCT-34]NBN79587.1 YdiU family protein [Pannonibacter sp. XCT-53]
MSQAIFSFDNSYARDLEGFYVPWQGDTAPAPRMVRLNRALATELGLDAAALEGEAGARLLSGTLMPAGASPLAQAYAGHQFGGFSPQLGDGRALLIGEILTPDGRRRDIHLKGSGRTPFSRGGDGKATLGPMLREYIIGEAMHALGIPTTRALAVVATGEQVLRDTILPGAVLARVAASHIRVGTFQFFAARSEHERLRQLTAYTMTRHDPDLVAGGAVTGDAVLAFLDRVIGRQADLVARWMLVGFIHGVMNTDNMAVSGETIDYGPCAFMDRYDPRQVFSSIDTHGRYAYGNQPAIAQWNLARFAETLLPLLDASEDAAIEKATTAINAFPARFQTAWLDGMRRKLGLTNAEETDEALATLLFDAMAAGRDGVAADMTGTFRALARFATGEIGTLDEIGLAGDKARDFAVLYTARLSRDVQAPDDRRRAMEAVNPVYVPRNHKVEQALTAAIAGDLQPFERLLEVLAAPFTERPGLEDHAVPAPLEFGPYRTFCGT